VGYQRPVTDDRDPELTRILEDIRGAADRAVQLSGDLLSFSRRIQAKTEDVDLNTLMGDDGSADREHERPRRHARRQHARHPHQPSRLRRG
jgi:signal transduction histidine kinase